MKAAQDPDTLTGKFIGLLLKRYELNGYALGFYAALEHFQGDLESVVCHGEQIVSADYSDVYIEEGDPETPLN